MDLDQLQSVRDRERQTDRLQQLRESFYEEAADFVADLRAERDQAAAEADDPFDSPRVNRLSDRIRTAEQTLEAIYEKRVGKVVKAATFAAADLPAEAEGMTREEAALFETLVDEIEANRAQVLGRLSGDRRPEGGEAAGEPGDWTDTGDDAGSSVSAADVMGEGESAGQGPDEPGAHTDADDQDGSRDGGSSENGGPSEAGTDRVDDDSSADEDSEASTDSGVEEDSSGDGGPGEESDEASSGGTPSGEAPSEAAASEEGASDVERELVRIIDDVGPILGVDEREYDLAADDVVTLPAENARPLVERGAAERLE